MKLSLKRPASSKQNHCPHYSDVQMVKYCSWSELGIIFSNWDTVSEGSRDGASDSFL